MTDRNAQAGFVLVNALILVAAMSAAAVLLLARAEEGRARLEAVQTSEALRDNLDAVEALGRALLKRDIRRGDIDSPEDIWAQPIRDVELDRGVVTGVVTDQQGLFNVNWLSVRENDRAAEAFPELLARLGLSPQIADVIQRYVSGDGPKNRSAYSGLDPAMMPLGGQILVLDQLAAMPEISARDFAVLRPHITAIPGGTQLNVNTASEMMLRAMLPELSGVQISSILRRREDSPFENVDVFFEELGEPTDIEENPEAINAGLFSVKSNWFGGVMTAEIGTRGAHREVLYRRSGGNKVAVEWRLTDFGSIDP